MMNFYKLWLKQDMQVVLKVGTAALSATFKKLALQVSRQEIYSGYFSSVSFKIY
jgi:hypothetical protein